MTSTARMLPRWYLLYASPAWSPTKFDEDGLIEIVSKFFGTLRNVYNFFALYSNQDDLDPASLDVPYAKRPELDRWIISKYNKLIKEVTADMDQYDHMKAVRKITGLRYRRSCPTGISEEQEEDSGRKNWTKTRSRFMQRPMK